MPTAAPRHLLNGVRPHVRIKHDRDRRPAWPPGIHLMISGFRLRAMTRKKNSASHRRHHISGGISWKISTGWLELP